MSNPAKYPDSQANNTGLIVRATLQRVLQEKFREERKEARFVEFETALMEISTLNVSTFSKHRYSSRSISLEQYHAFIKWIKKIAKHVGSRWYNIDVKIYARSIQTKMCHDISHVILAPEQISEIILVFEKDR